MSDTMQLSQSRTVFEEAGTSAWVVLDDDLAITEEELAAANGEYIEFDPQRDRDRAAYHALVAAQDMPLIEDEADDEAYEQATRGHARPVAKPLPID